MPLAPAEARRLTALVEDILVPAGRFKGLRRTSEILPQQFHRGKFFLKTHILQRQVHSHNPVYTSMSGGFKLPG